MSTIYLSGPMSGLPDHNYPAFHRAAKRLRALGHTVLNPAEVDETHNPTPGTHQPWSWYMRHALRMIADAEMVVVLDGWHKSRGALEEVRIAGLLDIPVELPERVDPRFWGEDDTHERPRVSVDVPHLRGTLRGAEQGQGLRGQVPGDRVGGEGGGHETHIRNQ